MKINKDEVNISDKLEEIVKDDETFGFDEIRKLLPHDIPFIFVDKVLELEKGKRIVCLKNISGNDPWFRGHFPDYAVMPGALMIEALAQSMLILALKSKPELKNKLSFLGSVKARFLRPIVPGDQVILEVQIEKIIAQGAVVSAVAMVENQKAITANITFGIFHRKS